MAITINGTSNTITGLAAGGLPDNTIDNGSMADDAIGVAELSATGTASSSTYLRGDNSWATIASGGLTEADQWRITSDVTGGADPLTSNWERNDTGFDKVGTGMSESSGVFTFPSTGIWLVDVRAGARLNGDSNMLAAFIKFTTNNSSYSNYAAGYGNINNTSGTWYGGANCMAILDISDTANCKVKITVSGNDNAIIEGNSGQQITGVTFLKLGAT